MLVFNEADAGQKGLLCSVVPPFAAAMKVSLPRAVQLWALSIYHRHPPSLLFTAL
jgi:hypothetical protein